jgi:outer membrane receptor protein involved in Fe transport
VGLATIFGSRPIYTRAWINNYAAKLTFKINNSNNFETSVFGDPTSTNNTAFRSVTAKNTTVFSSQQYQTRNFVGRYNGTLSPTWLVNADVTWNHNEFTETPQNPDVFSIVDRTTSITPTIQGLGFVENHNADNFSYEIDTSKTVRWLGTHTFMLGGTEQFLNYDDIKSRTGGTFSLPGIPTPVNATFSLSKFKPSKTVPACPTCPFFTDPAGDSVQVLLSSSRSEFGPPVVSTEGLGMALYGQDTWTINKHLNFNLGLRWDQYRMKGVQSSYTFTDNWAPRLGIAYDPFGDRKSKLYLNWARYNYQMPLDAAIRSLSQELDLVGLRIVPEFNPDGTINVIPDATHILNGQFGFAGFATSQQALEGFAPGTKMQYEDEYVGGIEHDFGHGLVVSARYVDRRLRRVVEDMGGVSPEAADASDVDGNFPLAQIFSIGNPSSTLDLFTNEPAPTIQPIGSACGGAGVVASTDANANNFPGDVQACFSNLNGVNGLIGGSPTPDGIPDGFANPVRNYQAAEFEVNKGFSAGWLMRFNYRLAYLRGNYEGAFRNDNGQTDPSISSLFDFTTGKLNLLGDQFAAGPLNTDRHHVGNLFLSYTFGASDFMKHLSGLTLGTGMRIQSGTPISEFADHPVYGNAGEVPLGGRGKLGRTQPSGAIDLHGEYAHKMSERYTFKVGADLFNVTNSQPVTLIDQNRDLSFNAPGSNLDFRTPLSFQNPFYSRFSVKLEF